VTNNCCSYFEHQGFYLSLESLCCPRVFSQTHVPTSQTSPSPQLLQRARQRPQTFHPRPQGVQNSKDHASTIAVLEEGMNKLQTMFEQMYVLGMGHIPLCKAILLISLPFTLANPPPWLTHRYVLTWVHLYAAHM
jgi:hypothetical protein